MRDNKTPAFPSPTASESDSAAFNPATSVALRQIMDLLVSGMFASGCSIRESRISERLGINRNAVREALNQLTGLGVLEYAPYSGYRLLPYTLHDALDWDELRLCVEPEAIRLSEGRPLYALYSQMGKILEMEAACIASGDLRGAARCDVCFHLKIVESSGNRRISSVYLQGVLLSLANSASLSAATLPLAHDGAAPDMETEYACYNSAHLCHERIFRELSSGSVEEAIRLDFNHIDLSCKRLRKHLLDASRRKSETGEGTSGTNPIASVVERLLNDT